MSDRRIVQIDKTDQVVGKKADSYFNFSGRIGRAGYLATVAGILLGSIVTGTITQFTAQRGALELVGLAALLFWLVGTLWVGLGVCAKRLHDFGWSEWWRLLFIVPGVNVVLLLALAVIPGNAGSNRYGPQPVA